MNCVFEGQSNEFRYIKPEYFTDNRGVFFKVFENGIFEENGIKLNISECFITKSQKNVLRGMHFQLHHPQTKLVTVVSGRAYDVIIDLRTDSPNYKKWYSQELNEYEKGIMLIPAGFAHGFLALEDNTSMLYLCAGKYDKETDTGIRYDDPDIAIKWPCSDGHDLIISERDKSLMSFAEYEKKPMEI